MAENSNIDKHQIFISSKMHRGVLKKERCAVRQTINKFPTFKPWDWDNEGPAGPRTPMAYCLEQVEKSYALVLLVGRTLTNHTKQEYDKAISVKIKPFVFFKQVSRDQAAQKFRADLTSSWLTFKNEAELKTMVRNSLNQHIYNALSSYAPTIGTKVKRIKFKK